jgi:hypothetical protein
MLIHGTISICLLAQAQTEISPSTPFGSSLDEFLFLQPSESGTLLSKQANGRVCNRISHGLDALLKPSEPLPTFSGLPESLSGEARGFRPLECLSK